MNAVIAREMGKSENGRDRARPDRDTAGRRIILPRSGLLEQGIPADLLRGPLNLGVRRSKVSWAKSAA